MGYFDSAKNRVLWQRELDQLKVERDRRAKFGFDGTKGVASSEKEFPGRQRVTFAQLEKEELEASGKEKTSRSRNRNMERTHDVQKHREKDRTM